MTSVELEDMRPEDYQPRGEFVRGAPGPRVSCDGAKMSSALCSTSGIDAEAVSEAADVMEHRLVESQFALERGSTG